jgi:hypothetical protein
MPRVIKLTLQPIEPLNLSASKEESEMTLKAQNIQEVASSDYRKLINKPTINSTELFDNYDEIDPTVPAWAKGEAPQQMDFLEIVEIFNNVFN